MKRRIDNMHSDCIEMGLDSGNNRSDQDYRIQGNRMEKNCLTS